MSCRVDEATYLRMKVEEVQSEKFNLNDNNWDKWVSVKFIHAPWCRISAIYPEIWEEQGYTIRSALGVLSLFVNETTLWRTQQCPECNDS